MVFSGIMFVRLCRKLNVDENKLLCRQCLCVTVSAVSSQSRVTGGESKQRWLVQRSEEHCVLMLFLEANNDF